jgi:protoporphyrinogen oxidase
MSASQSSEDVECCIVGAGPAGLAAGLELARHGVSSILVLDRHPIVGGLARTETFDGARFDVGPHRFFTKNAEINALWHNLLGSDFVPVDRVTRILFNKQLFNYPIAARDVLTKLGWSESLKAMLSYLHAQLARRHEPKTFEEWVVAKFGWKLYRIFFKTYTEKVWGIPCSQIDARWAAQRIKGLDLRAAIKNALFPGGEKIKTLVERFHYPVRGAGQMYEAMAERIVKRGGRVRLGCTVVAVHRDGNRVRALEVEEKGGQRFLVTAQRFFSSMPITLFFKAVVPAESHAVLEAANTLYYREHITVNLRIDGTNHFPDQWIYVHAPEVKMARLANYNNFSPAMVSTPGKTGVSVEYFTFQNEDLWKLSNEQLKSLACDELDQVQLVPRQAIEEAWVVRETESYPTYYLAYEEHFERLRRRLDEFENVAPIGRGGMYKYNNQDHSTLTGLLAARNYLKLPGSPYNVWNVNIDAEYHESGKATD